MSERIQKKDVVQRLARLMGTDEQIAEAWVDAFTETLYEAFKEGRSVTLPGLGGFYIRPHRDSWTFKFNPSQKLRALFGWSSSYNLSLRNRGTHWRTQDGKTRTTQGDLLLCCHKT